jgi:hypothetical protein
MDPRAMPDETVLLAALFAPGSVESEMCSVQAALFDEHGLASAQALPPLIPLAILDPERIFRGFLQEMNVSVRSGWRMRLTEAVWVGGHLFAGIESRGVWEALRSVALKWSVTSQGSLFPVAEGFYLGCGEASPEMRSLIQPVMPASSFGSCTIALMKVRTALPGPEWWREVSWEVVQERPLRGRKAQ